MKLTILGSGSFISDTERLSPGYLLQSNDKNILVDCGAGTMLQLAKLGIGIKDIDYIFVTHFHSDHIGELVPITMRYKLLLSLYEPDIQKTIKVIGPKNTDQCLKDLYFAHRHKIAWDLRGIEISEIEEKTKYDSFAVTPFEVNHIGVEAVAYRFEIEDKIIVFSGDTISCEGIETASNDAGLLVCDCITPDAPDLAKGAHLTSLQVGELCQKSHVKKVVLSHIMPISYNRDLVTDVKKSFNGEVILAEDLMEINL